MIKRTIYIGNPAYVHLENSQLRIRNTENEVISGQLPVEDLGILILDNPQITITHGLIQVLQNNNTAIISCDEKHLPASLMLPLNKHHVLTDRHRIQLDASIPLKKQLWKQSIQSKLKNQGTLLEQFGMDGRKLHYLSKRVSSGDMENREAQGASYFWSLLLNGAKRERFGEPPNAHLNYGYAILRALVARALVSSGLYPAIGIHHRNKYNPYCLADDIMEPYRPFVDKLVFQLSESERDAFHISKEAKVELLKIPTLDVIIGKKFSPLMIAVSRTTNSLFECFNNTRKQILYPSFP